MRGGGGGGPQPFSNAWKTTYMYVHFHQACICSVFHCRQKPIDILISFSEAFSPLKGVCVWCLCIPRYCDALDGILSNLYSKWPVTAKGALLKSRIYITSLRCGRWHNACWDTRWRIPVRECSDFRKCSLCKYKMNCYVNENVKLALDKVLWLTIKIKLKSISAEINKNLFK